MGQHRRTHGHARRRPVSTSGCVDVPAGGSRPDAGQPARHAQVPGLQHCQRGSRATAPSWSPAHDDRAIRPARIRSAPTRHGRTYGCDIGAYEFAAWVVGQPLPRPPSISGSSLPQWTVDDEDATDYHAWSPATMLDLAIRPTRRSRRLAHGDGRGYLVAPAGRSIAIRHRGLAGEPRSCMFRRRRGQPRPQRHHRWLQCLARHGPRVRRL